MQKETAKCENAGFSANSFILPGPGRVIHLSRFSRAVVQTTYTPSCIDLKHNSAKPLATVGQGDFPMTAVMLDNSLHITRSEMFS